MTLPPEPPIGAEVVDCHDVRWEHIEGTYGNHYWMRADSPDGDPESWVRVNEFGPLQLVWIVGDMVFHRSSTRAIQSSGSTQVRGCSSSRTSPLCPAHTIYTGLRVNVGESEFMARPRKQFAEQMWTQPDGEASRGPATAADMVDTADPAFGLIVQAARHLHSLGFDLQDPGIVQRAIDVGRKNYATDTAPPPMRHEASPARPGEVVYYMRLGNRVKIGFSANLATRLATINPEELLATEPGGRSVERERHGQFNALRTRGEWFRLEGPLVTHIRQLRARAAA